MCRCLVSKLLRVTGIKRRRYLPRCIYPDDVFLVSFPKSGTTWLRFLVGNYLTGNRCHFTNLHLTMPGIHLNPGQCDVVERPRFVQSHFAFDKQYRTHKYPNVVYLARDGRDVATSYFYHRKKHGLIDLSATFADHIMDFNEGRVGGFGSWSEHVSSWLDRRSDRFLLVRYEDMKADAECVLVTVLEFAGIQPEPHRVRDAVMASDRDKLQRLEREQRSEIQSFIPSEDPSIPFVRQGEVGDWTNHFDEQMLRNFISAHGVTLRRLGYL